MLKKLSAAVADGGVIPRPGRWRREAQPCERMRRIALLDGFAEGEGAGPKTVNNFSRFNDPGGRPCFTHN